MSYECNVLAQYSTKIVKQSSLSTKEHPSPTSSLKICIKAYKILEWPFQNRLEYFETIGFDVEWKHSKGSALIHGVGITTQNKH